MAAPTSTQETALGLVVSTRPWYRAVFGTILAAYAALTVMVLFAYPTGGIDAYVFGLHIGGHNPGWGPIVRTVVVAGQRGPSTLVALPWFIWRAWRQRSWRPLILLGAGLLLLNLTVGAMKIATGRIGPRHTVMVDEVLAGGTIFPSGHVSNSVVLFGLLAWIAVRYRRTMITLAIVMPIVIGACTIYQRTHWVTDIFGGWLAGGLVLMLLPWVMPTAERVAAPLTRQLDRWGTWFVGRGARPAWPRPALHANGDGASPVPRPSEGSGVTVRPQRRRSPADGLVNRATQASRRDELRTR